MPTNAARNNGRVTNLHLSEKLDWVIAGQAEVLSCVKEQEVRLRAVEIEQGKQGERLKFRTWAHGIAETMTGGIGLTALLQALRGGS